MLNQIKAFISTVTNSHLPSGARSLMEASGLGKLSPNMILCGFLDNWQNRSNMVNDYVEIIQYVESIVDIYRTYSMKYYGLWKLLKNKDKFVWSTIL